MGMILRLRELPEHRNNRSYGTTVEFGGGLTKGTGYMAHSDRVGPGVLIVQDRYGLQDWLKHLADALNDDGFTVLVPDLYDGRAANTAADADALWGELEPKRTGRRLTDAAAFLAENWHPRLGVVGCGLGADLAQALCEMRAPDAVVLFCDPVKGCDEEDFGAPLLEISPVEDGAYDAAVAFLRRYLS